MPILTAFCYCSSLIFFGLGYSKTLVLKNAVSNHMNSYDFTMNVTRSTSYYVLAIILAVLGSVIFYLKTHKVQETVEIHDHEFTVIAGGGFNERRRMNLPDLNVQLTRSDYGLELDRRMTS